MAPLGFVSFAVLGLRLIHSALRHPSRQEQQALKQLQGQLRDRFTTTVGDNLGNVTILLKELDNSRPDPAHAP
jgi:hypothetical protein